MAQEADRTDHLRRCLVPVEAMRRSAIRHITVILSSHMIDSALSLDRHVGGDATYAHRLNFQCRSISRMLLE
jgi:hypothetical protein